jgi:chromosome segregation ATPase
MENVGWLVAAMALVGLVVRMIGPWRKQISDSEQKIREELHAQIDAQREQMEADNKRHEAQLETERKRYDTELRAFNLERDDMGDRLARMEKAFDRQQIRHNAERALDRHRLNNINACFDALLLLLKANPEKAKEAVTMIEEMRAKQILAEAEEKAIIRAAEIQADEVECDHDGN